jgi:Glyoxalase/Bleomycin resistance protein/Dioxygenase superfamily
MTVRAKFACLTTLLLVFNAAGYARSSNAAAPTFTAAGAFFAIVVTDVDASADWYESNLGLHLLKRGRSHVCRPRPSSWVATICLSS